MFVGWLRFVRSVVCLCVGMSEGLCVGLFVCVRVCVVFFCALLCAGCWLLYVGCSLCVVWVLFVC